MEIEKIEFKTKLFGYEKKQVRDFLNELSSDITNLLKENASLKEKITDLQKIQEDYQTMEKKLQSTLMVIQEFKTSVQETAKKEAEQSLNETKLQCNVMITDAQRKVAELRKEYDLAMLEKRKIIEKIRFFIQEESVIVNSFESQDK